MKKICYVNVRETSYTKRFLEFFRKKIPKQMEIRMISKIEEMEMPVEDVFVISDKKEFLDEVGTGVFLSDRPVAEGKNEIFMYQKKEEIWQQFCEIVDMDAGEKQRTEKNGRICCIFSPEGGEEKTRLALQEALERAEKDKVLYISMCPVPVFFPEELSETPSLHHQGLAEWILAVENGMVEETLEKLAYPYGKISILAPVAHYKDLLDFSKEEIEKIMEGLKQQNLFSKIILEVGQFFEYTFELLDYADEIIMPLEDGFLAAIRRHVLREYCMAENREEIWNKIIFSEITFPKIKNKKELEKYLQMGEVMDGKGSKRENS